MSGAGPERSERADGPPGTPDDDNGRLADAILHTARQPLLVLDADLRVTAANRAFYRAFGVDAAETQGRLLYDLGNGQWNIAELRTLLETILPGNGTVEDFRVTHEFDRIGRRAMLLNAHRMVRAGRADAILLAIDDITEQEHMRWLLEGEKEYARKLIDASRDALLILGWDLKVRAANAAFYAAFRTTPAETEGRPVFVLGNGQWNIPRLRELLEKVLPGNDAFEGFEVEHEFQGLGPRIMVLNARRVDHMQLILLAIEDQTAIRQADRALRRNEALLSSVLRHAPIGIGLVDRDGGWLLRNALLERLSDGMIPPHDPAQVPHWHADDGSGPADWPGAHALRGEGPASRVFRKGLDGQERWLRVSAAPVETEGGIEYAVVTVEDITEDKQSEQERELLLGELNHRVKNLFGVIRALVAQGNGGTAVEAYRTTLKGRLEALARAHALALEGRWGPVDLGAIAARTLEPYAGAIALDGPPAPLPARQALSLSLTLHELATNAVKHGALSVPQGRARLAWSVGPGDGTPRLDLVWEETGGPPVAPPAQRGFGTNLIDRIFAYDLQGDAEIDFRPEGLRVRAWFPLA